MELSKLVAIRTKETPSDAKIASHILMLRAGYLKQVANGIYTLTALGQKACLNIENIIREEMNKIGGQEVKFPVVMPKDLWEESGRYYSIGSEMVRFEDRANHPMLLGMTHEEASVHLVKNWITSYTQLPFMVYQIQTKFRDEPRSRGGLIRVREFTMKDAYSFHETNECLDEFYKKIKESYIKIYKKIGLKNVISVNGDNGMMGGKVSNEFMFLTEAGEDSLAVCNECGYSANQEVASCIYDEKENKDEILLLKEVDTGSAHEISEVCSLLKTSPDKCIKAVVYADKNDFKNIFLCFVRGDIEINEVKLKNLCKKEVVLFDAKDNKLFSVGNIGPKGFDKIEDIKVFFDNSLKNGKNFVAGANKSGKHFVNFNISRDYGDVDFVDIAKIKEGAVCPKCKKGVISLSNGIEIGHIFQNGTRYTKDMNMFIKTKDGKEINPPMGCYGIGVGRNLACVIEENHDENGICLPLSIAPYKVHIVPLRLDDENVKSISYSLYKSLLNDNIDVLIDDRDDVMPGVKFADADLMGMPIRVLISPRSLKNDEVEIKMRKSGEVFMVKTGDSFAKIKEIISNNK